MDFSFSEAQDELGKLTRSIAATSTDERLRAAESGADRFDQQLWDSLAKAGILSVTDFGLLEHCTVLVELGRAVAPVPYLASVVAASALERFGVLENPSAVHTAALADDEVFAEPVGDGWRLSGAKSCVPAGALAEVILVPASSPDGVQVFAVHPSEVSITRQRIVDGDSEAWIDFDDVPVDSARLLGGQEVLDWLLTRMTVGLCALQLGVTERALELTTEHARTRVQFDRPIGSFQAVGQRLADAYVDVEAIRLTLWQAAWRVSEGLPAEVEVAAAKFWAADAGHRVAHTAVHVHGGMGIDTDHPLHRYFVAAKRNEFTLGGATAQLRKIGAALASTPA
ncbi:acyl-CoA dehydrogenase family protein [Kibdelosporangium phytohabitans]|uniref:Acyl-CoA dehydrogenase n=1 Tax=Kibdelosporangium phytohabitans TaxID=860235 RepID=A0A0N9I9H7_9PSEU|nr:acyl-CoA dehydrogenase [Kibdelosporangium phytohabitans]ALG12640.1 acyl-CoA dehydrogenase [Kibdelosporangium phytohabitans]MBE1464287.1 alkylation response protein AidB-like acyl-CoA dehydrogenase [Kibdelosporangium phytohabitans]